MFGYLERVSRSWNLEFPAKLELSAYHRIFAKLELFALEEKQIYVTSSTMFFMAKKEVGYFGRIYWTRYTVILQKQNVTMCALFGVHVTLHGSIYRKRLSHKDFSFVFSFPTEILDTIPPLLW